MSAPADGWFAAAERRARAFDAMQGEAAGGCEGGCGRAAAVGDDFCRSCSREAAALFGWSA